MADRTASFPQKTMAKIWYNTLETTHVSDKMKTQSVGKQQIEMDLKAGWRRYFYF
jgi:hypothetical protein